MLVSLALAHPLLNGYHSVPAGREPSVSEQPVGEHSASLGGIAPEGEQIATYREIAAHWGLAGVDVARVKAKRAGWRSLPRNHPADPVRVAIPRATWDTATPALDRGARSSSSAARADSARPPGGADATLPGVNDARPPGGRKSSRDEEIARALATLRELWTRVHRAETAAAAERARAARAEAEAIGLREELVRAEVAAAEARAATTEATAAAERAQMEWDQMAVERDRLRAEMDAWTAGGPFARAWRAFLNRRC